MHDKSSWWKQKKSTFQNLYSLHTKLYGDSIHFISNFTYFITRSKIKLDKINKFITSVFWIPTLWENSAKICSSSKLFKPANFEDLDHKPKTAATHRLGERKKWKSKWKNTILYFDLTIIQYKSCLFFSEWVSVGSRGWKLGKRDCNPSFQKILA